MTRLPEARVREADLIRFAECSQRATVDEVAAIAREVLELREAVKRLTPPEGTIAVVVSLEMVERLSKVQTAFRELTIVCDDYRWPTLEISEHRCSPPSGEARDGA